MTPQQHGHFTETNPQATKKRISPRKRGSKKVLVLFWDLVKVTATMKRLYTLIVLLGLVIGVVTGCNDSGSKPADGTTNPPAATPGTNAPAK